MMDNLQTLLTTANDGEESRSNYHEMIETVIASLEQNDSAMVNHRDRATIWKFQYGSVDVYVQLTGESDDDLLTVWSPILQLPVADEASLLRHLMTLNWSGTFETCFAIFDEKIVVSFQRTLEDLSAAEVSRILTLVATIADENDEDLKAKFG
jgi:hypothetical protein